MSRHVVDHAECHRDIDGLLAEINRLQGILNRMADLVIEAQTYRVERADGDDCGG